MYSKFWLLCAALLAVAVVSIIPQAQAADPAVRCESGKLKVSGKYAACLLKAEAKAVAKGQPVDYTKCQSKFSDKYAGTEIKADGQCPSQGDQTNIKDFLDGCNASVAAALAGGDLLLDPLTCDGALDACDAASAACNSNLSATNAELGTCNTDLDGCLSRCGNGVIDAGEDCEPGLDLDVSCGDLGLLGFPVGCDQYCRLDTSGCEPVSTDLVPALIPCEERAIINDYRDCLPDSCIEFYLKTDPTQPCPEPVSPAYRYSNCDLRFADNPECHCTFDPADYYVDLDPFYGDSVLIICTFANDPAVHDTLSDEEILSFTLLEYGCDFLTAGDTHSSGYCRERGRPHVHPIFSDPPPGF